MQIAGTRVDIWAGFVIDPHQKTNLAGRLLSLQSWEEIGMDGNLCACVVAKV